MRTILTLLAVLAWVAPVLAQTKASDKEWNAMIDAAKKEGKVVVAGSPDPVMRNEIMPKVQRALRYRHRIARRPLERNHRSGKNRTGVGHLQRRRLSGGTGHDGGHALRR